jgi:hypothetical protein
MESEMTKFTVIDGGRSSEKSACNAEVPDKQHDLVGELMLEVLAMVVAEPMTPEMLAFSLSKVPVGNYDCSTIN